MTPEDPVSEGGPNRTISTPSTHKLHDLAETLAQQGDRNGALNLVRRGIGCNIYSPKSLPLLYKIGLDSKRDIQAACAKEMR
jgi:hypothetical protein